MTKEKSDLQILSEGLQEIGRKRREEEKERKTLLTKELCRIFGLEFKEKILEYYKLIENGTMTQSEFLGGVFDMCREELGLDEEDTND